jgi:hypothetical protein
MSYNIILAFQLRVHSPMLLQIPKVLEVGHSKKTFENSEGKSSVSNGLLPTISMELPI